MLALTSAVMGDVVPPLINLPVGLAACFVVTRVLRGGAVRLRQRRLDLSGLATLLVAAEPAPAESARQ